MKTLIFNGSPRKNGDTVSLIRVLLKLASPIYFNELTGELLSVSSRLQSFFCSSYFRHVKPIEKSKKGAVILTGGGDGNLDKIFGTACALLHTMNTRDIYPLVYSFDTNNIPAVDDPAAVEGAIAIAGYFSAG